MTQLIIESPEKNTSVFQTNNPANIELFKFNNKNPGKSCETCSKLTIKTP